MCAVKKNSLNLKVLQVLAGASLLAVSAFMATSTVTAEEAQMKDEEIVALLTAISENEVNAAQEASKKQTSQEVLDYAVMMEKEHGKSLDQAQELAEELEIAPAANADAVAEKRQKGAEDLAKLAPLNGDEFAEAYIETMIADHEEAISLIKEKMLPNVQSQELKDHLTKTRDHLVRHLQRAKNVQERLG